MQDFVAIEEGGGDPLCKQPAPPVMLTAETFSPPLPPQALSQKKVSKPHRMAEVAKEVLGLMAHIGVLVVLALIILSYLQQRDMTQQIESLDQRTQQVEEALRRATLSSPHPPQQDARVTAKNTQEMPTTKFTTAQSPTTHSAAIGPAATPSSRDCSSLPHDTTVTPFCKTMNSEIVASAADRYLVKYPTRPLKGLWEVLGDLSLDTSVAVTMVSDSRCGLERRAMSDDVDLRNTPRSASYLAQYNRGLTPLMMAVVAARSDVASALVKLGANHRAVEDYRSFTALHFAATIGSIPSIKLLLQHGADVNALDVGGCTPVLEAAWCANIDAVEVLIANGANKSIAKYDGVTILQAFESSPYRSLLSEDERARMVALLSQA